jgi:tetratricopeptide (TPR) repeat protein
MSRSRSSDRKARQDLVAAAVRHRRIGGRLLLAVVLIALAGLILLVLNPRSRPKGIPFVPTNGLDPAVIRVLEDGRRRVRAEPRAGDAWGQLASTLHHYEYVDEAHVAYQEAARWSPRDPRWPYLEALLLMNRDADRSVQQLRRAAELAPDHLDGPRLRLAQLLAERGRTGEAGVEFQRLIERQPAHAAALLGLARLRYQEGRAAEAMTFLDRCQQDRQTRKSAHELRATIERALGHTTEAEQAARLAAALPLDPPWPDPFWEEAMRFNVGCKAALEQAGTLLDAGQTAEAVALLRSTTEAYPDNAEAWYRWGAALNRQGDALAAERALREHLRRAIESPKGYAQLGVALLAQKRFAEAVPVLEAGLALKPTWRELHANLGYAAVHLGQVAAAENHYRSALACDPNHRPTYQALAELLRRRGRTNEAVALLQQAAALSPAPAAGNP